MSLPRVGRAIVRALALILALPVLLVAGCAAVVTVIAIVDDISGASERASAERDAASRRDDARYVAAIEARGGYIVLRSGASEFRFPAYGGTCSGGRDGYSHVVGLELPELTVRQKPCGAPYMNSARAAVFLKPHDGSAPRPVRAISGERGARSPASLRPGDQHRRRCRDEAGMLPFRECSVLDGISASGVHYSAACNGLFCRLNTGAHGIDVEAYFKPQHALRAGQIVDRLAAYIDAARQDGR